MEPPDEHVGEPNRVCPGCGQARWPVEFWPRSVQGQSNTSRYEGRRERCRRCVAAEVSARSPLASPGWVEPLPSRKTLRQRLAEGHQAVEQWPDE